MNNKARVRKVIEFDYPDRPSISRAILAAAKLTHGKESDSIFSTRTKTFPTNRVILRSYSKYV